MITVIPGRATYLPVEFRDDLGHNVTSMTVYFAKFDHYHREMSLQIILLYYMGNHVKEEQLS